MENKYGLSNSQTRMLLMSKLTIGINHVSNIEYHADKQYMSSSNFKTLLKNPKQFYDEKILGIKPEKSSNTAFDEGSLTHSMILEPHKIDNEFAFWKGLRKQGSEYEAFEASARKRTVISQPQKIRCEGYYKAFSKNDLAVSLIQGGLAEQTLCQNYYDLLVKTRCDYINVEKGYIVDVKTSSFPVDLDSFKMTIGQFSYELSAALYVAIAEQFYNKKFDFYFLAIAKKDLDCQVFKLSSATAERGNRMILDAIKIYKSCKASGDWENKSSLTIATEHEILEV